MFISSTFRDMHAERDHLVREVFPALRERLQEYRVHLVDIDLRWGVTQQQCDNDQALELCLQWVGKCKPFLLCIIGERYGYVPRQLPKPAVTRYPWLRDCSGRSITELEIHEAIMGDSTSEELALFFFRDPAFIDKVPKEKRADVLGEGTEAAAKLEQLKNAIREAGLAEPPVEKYPCHYRGVRVAGRLVAEELSPDARRVFESVADDGIVDPSEAARLDPPLREFVHRHGVVYTGGLETFGRIAHDRLWHAIRAQLRLPDAPPAWTLSSDTLTGEDELHDRFIESRLNVYIERKHVQSEILEHIYTGKESTPLLLTGPSGSGKSAIMAWLARRLENGTGSNTNTEEITLPLIILHFVGASPASTSLRQMLRRFCAVLRRELTSASRAPTEDQPPAESFGDVRGQTDELILEFHKLIQQIPRQKEVVLIIDALNQLDWTDNARAMHWLPKNLPDNVKVIASCIAEPWGLEIQGDSQISGVDYEGHQVLTAFRHRRHRRVNVPALTISERIAIIREVPSLSAKTLDEEQISLILQNSASCNPLFLLVALEELRCFGFFEQLESRIKRFPSKGDALTEIFQQVIERLETDSDPGLVRQILSLLACSRNGLSEKELEELVAPASGTNTSPDRRKASLHTILRQIRPYTHYRGALLDFFHLNFPKSVHLRYLKASDQCREYHSALAGYFRCKADPDDEKSWGGDYPRGLSELPYHLTEAADYDALQEILTDFGFLEAKLLEFGVQPLLEDFDRALSRRAGVSTEPTAILIQLRDTLRLSAGQLKSHPEQLLSQLTGRLMYEESAAVKSLLQSFASRASRPWFQPLSPGLTPPGPLLWLSEVANQRFEGGKAKVCLTPDADKIIVAASDGGLSVFSPGSVLPLLELDGDSTAGKVLDAVVTESGQKVTVLRENGSVNVWNLSAQAMEDTPLCIESTCLQGTCYALDSDGDLLTIGTGDGSIEVRRLNDAEIQTRLTGHNAEVSAVAVSSTANRVVATYVDGTVRAWELETGKTVIPETSTSEDTLRLGSEDWDARFGESPANVLKITDDARRVFIGNAEKVFSNMEHWFCAEEDIRGILTELGLDNEESRIHLEAYSNSPVFDLDVTPDNRYAVTLSQTGGLKLWNLTKAKSQLQLRQHDESNPVVAVTPDRRRVLSIADDGLLKVWELTKGEVLPPLRGYRQPAFDLKISQDSRFAVVQSAGFGQVWDLEELALGRILGDLPKDSQGLPTVFIRLVIPLAPGDRAAIVYGDGKVVYWNLASGDPEHTTVRLSRSVRCAAGLPDGRWLLYSPDGEFLFLCDLQAKFPERKHHVDNKRGGAMRLFAVPDAESFFIAMDDGRAWNWNPDQDSPIQLPDLRPGRSPQVLTPDGNYAIFYDDHRTLSLYDLRTDSELANFTAEARFSSFALSTDGQLVTAGDDARRVHILWLTKPSD